MQKQAPLGIVLHLKKKHPPNITEIQFIGLIEIFKDASKADFVIYIDKEISDGVHRELNNMLLDYDISLPRANFDILLKPKGFIRLENVLVCKIKGEFRFYDLDDHQKRFLQKARKSKPRTSK
ncbi:MAG: hypothetical protein WCF92_01320 [bacterium]